MQVTFRPIDTWPGELTKYRKASPFKASYSDTLTLLDRELVALKAKVIVILEALRKVDRYGITKRGEQYTGWKALGGGIAVGPAAMTPDEAARFLEEQWLEQFTTPGPSAYDVKTDPLQRDRAYRHLAKRLHPDAGGTDEAFVKLDEARRVLEAVA